MAYAWDLETNTRQVKIFSVPHVRSTRKGRTNLRIPVIFMKWWQTRVHAV